MNADGTITAHLADTVEGIDITITVGPAVTEERVHAIAQGVVQVIWGDRPDLTLKLETAMRRATAGGVQ